MSARVYFEGEFRRFPYFPFVDLVGLETGDEESRERRRLKLLQQLNLLDTPAADNYDRLTQLATRQFRLPIAAITLTDQDRLWFKSEVGLGLHEVPRAGTPCAEVTRTRRLMVVPDLADSPMFQDSDLVAQGIRFYAGAPLVTRCGETLGTFCVLDRFPREFSPEEVDSLVHFAALVMSFVELERDLGRFDPISGLPNAKHLREDLAYGAVSGPPQEMLAVLLDLADPRQFGQLLGVLGPVYIEDVLRAALDVLRSVAGEQVRIYHVKTMSFLMLLEPNAGDTWQTVVRQCAQKLSEPVRCNGIPVTVQSVFGVAPFRFGIDDGRHVIRTAMSAAAEARQSELGFAVYNTAADSANRRKFALLNDIRKGLATKGQFSLVFQPRLDVRTGVCAGAEALLRWNHPDLGEVSPGEFIPLVEQTALMGAVTRWVVNATLAQIAEWQGAGTDVRVSMNISARNLEDPGFFREFELALLASKVASNCVELEFTESALIRNRARVIGQLHRIRALGVDLAIDDFGTGYSTFSYLHKLPASVLKLDGSFMRSLPESHKDQIVVRSVIAMAHDMGYRVVAEGVETPEAFRFLAECDCDEVQGYLFAKPLPAADFLTWLQEHEDRPVLSFAQLQRALGETLHLSA